MKWCSLILRGVYVCDDVALCGVLLRVRCIWYTNTSSVVC